MEEPTEKQIKEREKFYNTLIANIQQKCVENILDVRKYVNTALEKIIAEQMDYSAMKKYMYDRYFDMFVGVKEDLGKAYVESGKVTVGLINETAKEPILPPSKAIPKIPKTKAFNITNKILSEKAISIRSSKMANQVTEIIKDSFDNDLSIQEVQKKLDIVFGYRNKDGVITSKSKALIESGKFSHRSGHIYETYRIARTEVVRISHVQTTEKYKELLNKGIKCRLKMKAVLDEHTRDQSRQMNGYFANKAGRFLYPNGSRYFIYEAPPQYSINDREVLLIVLDRDKTENTTNIKTYTENKVYEDIFQNENVLKEMHAQTDKITEVEENSIKKYTQGYEGEYLAINGTLRGDLSQYEELLGSKISTQTQEKVNKWIENIDSAMNKTKLPQNTVLYRGGIDKAIGTIFKNKEIQDFIITNEVNETNLIKVKDKLLAKSFEEKGYMSTSYDKFASYRGKVKLKINAPKGINGMLVDKIGLEDEKEVLIKRNTQWKIKNITVEMNEKERTYHYLFDCYYNG